MKTPVMIALSLLGPLTLGCGGGTTTTDMATAGPDLAMPATADLAMPATADLAMMAAPDLALGPIPDPPAIGAQIDRLFRPAINTALTDPFGLCMTDPLMGCGAAAKGKTSDQVKDAYNAAGDPSKWATDWAGAIRLHLAIFDGADAKCRNQLGANPAKGDPTRYDTVAGLLAGDFLNVDTSTGTCKIFLGAELKALGVIASAECGGRAPSYDVIDAVYSALTAGTLTGVTDGVAAKASSPAKDDAFPFLGAPN